MQEGWEQPSRDTLSQLDADHVVRGVLGAAQHLRGGRPLDERMTDLCRHTATVLGCDRSSIMLWDGKAYHAAYNWGYPPEVAERFADYRVPPDAPLIAEMERTQAAVVVNNAREHPVLAKIARQATIEAIVMAPIVGTDDCRVGMLTAEFNEQARSFDQQQADLVLSLAALALGPLFETQRRQAEQKRAQLERLVLAEDEVRRRISRDVHDTALQSVLALALRLELASQSLHESGGQLDEMVHECRCIAERLRLLVEDLHPLSMQPTDLVDAFERLLARRAEQHGVSSILDARLGFEPSPSTQMGLYRFAEHALERLLAQGGTTRVEVVLRNTPTGTSCLMRADGPDVDLAETRSRDLFGTLHDVADMLGGHFRQGHDPETRMIEAELRLPDDLDGFDGLARDSR